MKDANLNKKVKMLGDSLIDLINSVDNSAEMNLSLDTFSVSSQDEMYGNGLKYSAPGISKKLVLRKNNDRFWSTESIDLAPDKNYLINNTPVLSERELGPSVVKSNLTQTGTLQNLNVAGSVNIDDYVFWDSGMMRLGIGTDQPSATLSIKSLDSEFVVDVEDENCRIGTFTNDDLEIVTGDIARVIVDHAGKVSVTSNMSVNGKLAVGMKHADDDTYLSVAGSIRFADKKMAVSDTVPASGTYKQGDIVWNSQPVSSSYIGWVCIRGGSPGEWKPFGLVS